MLRAVFQESGSDSTLQFCTGITPILLLCLGCGSSPQGPGLTEKAAVTVVASSTANDQLSQFELVLDSLTLTSDSGATVNLISTPIHTEFIHLNGTQEPLVQASIPQGNYVSATATFSASSVTCMTLNPAASDSLVISTFGGPAPGMTATVNLPAPIALSGTSALLDLDLQVSKSASFASCIPSSGAPAQYSITPTFNLSALTLSSSPTNSQNGLEPGLEGIVASVDAAQSTLTVDAADGTSCPATNGVSCNPPSASGPVWQIAADSGTLFQGVQNISQLTAGMAVGMDVVIQPGGSLLAQRISVYDTETSDLTVTRGPVQFLSNATPYLSVFSNEQLGQQPLPNSVPFTLGSATFQVSGQFTNLSSLPFSASFTSSNVVPGQTTFDSTHATQISPPPTYLPATTITLVPQTLDATVGAIGSEGNFTTYTVTLAPYDLFADLAVQPGQTTRISAPTTVVIYTDSNTQMLGAGPIAVGSVARFYGLVFNNGGALSMDCSQISPGVTE